MIWAKTKIKAVKYIYYGLLTPKWALDYVFNLSSGMCFGLEMPYALHRFDLNNFNLDICINEPLANIAISRV